MCPFGLDTCIKIDNWHNCLYFHYVPLFITQLILLGSVRFQNVVFSNKTTQHMLPFAIMMHNTFGAILLHFYVFDTSGITFIVNNAAITSAYSIEWIFNGDLIKSKVALRLSIVILTLNSRLVHFESHGQTVLTVHTNAFLKILFTFHIISIFLQISQVGCCLVLADPPLSTLIDKNLEME